MLKKPHFGAKEQDLFLQTGGGGGARDPQQRKRKSTYLITIPFVRKHPNSNLSPLPLTLHLSFGKKKYEMQHIRDGRKGQGKLKQNLHTIQQQKKEGK